MNVVPAHGVTRDKNGAVKAGPQLNVPAVPVVPGRYIKVPLRSPRQAGVFPHLLGVALHLRYFDPGQPGQSGQLVPQGFHCPVLVPGFNLPGTSFRPAACNAGRTAARCSVSRPHPSVRGSALMRADEARVPATPMGESGAPKSIETLRKFLRNRRP